MSDVGPATLVPQIAVVGHSSPIQSQFSLVQGSSPQLQVHGHNFALQDNLSTSPQGLTEMDDLQPSQL
jgi:hypothetical protein